MKLIIECDMTIKSLSISFEDGDELVYSNISSNYSPESEALPNPVKLEDGIGGKYQPKSSGAKLETSSNYFNSGNSDPRVGKPDSNMTDFTC